MANEKITIIGAGPAGLSTARYLAEKGIACTILEEHAEIGRPVNCSGLLSIDGSHKADLPIDDITVNQIRGAKLYAPDNSCLTIEKNRPIAKLINRDELDLLLAQRAEKAGAQIRTKTRLIDIRNNTLFLESNGRGEILKTNIIVGADGPSSKVRNLSGITSDMSQFIHSYQVKASGNFDPDFVKLYFGGFAWNFFAWVIPESKTRARIGLGCKTGLNPKKQFAGFIQQKKMNIEVLEESSFLIPCRKPLQNAVVDNRLLVGDAAFHTKATTGGGIIFSALAGKAAAESIAEHLQNKKPLTNYNQKTEGMRKELDLHWKIHNYFASLTDQQTNKLFAKLKHAKIEAFLSEHGNMDYPTEFIPKLMGNPRLLLMLPDAVKFWRS